MLNYKLFNRKIKKKNKKAQIGETITWIVSTLIIVFILIMFIYIASAMGKAKSVNPKKIQIKISESNEEISWIEIKTLFAKIINNNNENKIDEWISQEDIKDGS